MYGLIVGGSMMALDLIIILLNRTTPGALIVGINELVLGGITILGPWPWEI